MNDNKPTTISPRWGTVIILLALLALGIYASVIDAIVPRHGLPFELLCLCITVPIVMYSCSYTFDCTGIVVRLFGVLTARKVLWSEVNQVYLFRGWQYQNRVVSDTKIIITFNGCETFVPGVDNPSDFVAKHAFHSFGIVIPVTEADKISLILNKFFPSVEERSIK